MSFKLNIKVFWYFPSLRWQLEQKDWDVLGKARKIRRDFVVLCRERSSPLGFVPGKNFGKCWQSQRAAWQHLFPASTPLSPSCMIQDPGSLQSSPCPALPVPPWHSQYLLRAGRARNGIWDLPLPHPAPSQGWEEQDLSPQPLSWCLFLLPASLGLMFILGYCVIFLGCIMSISGSKCDLSVHIRFSHIYPLLASQEWECFGLFSVLLGL